VIPSHYGGLLIFVFYASKIIVEVKFRIALKKISYYKT